MIFIISRTIMPIISFCHFKSHPVSYVFPKCFHFPLTASLVLFFFFFFHKATLKVIKGAI